MSTDLASADPGDAEWQNLPVEHLQLRPGLTDGLRKRNILTVGAVLEFAAGGRVLQFVGAPEVLECARQLRASLENDTVNWRAYWEQRGFRYNHLAAAYPPFDELGEALADVWVDRRSLGNAGAMLQGGGFRTFADLIPQLRSGIGGVRGIGAGKIDDFFARLLQLVDANAAGKLPMMNRDRSTATQTSSDDAGHGQTALPDSVRSLGIDVLQIGAKSQWLLKAGCTSIGDLDDKGLARLAHIPAIGRRTVSAIERRIEELRAASSDGGIDWQQFSRISGRPLIPADAPVDARAMLHSLPDVIEQLCPYLSDDSYRDILRERLTQGPGFQPKLVELAKRVSPPVSRERIRQKEQKLLKQIMGTLIWEVDRKLGVQFHPGFSKFWKDAARAFEGEEEIDFALFVGRLAEVWNVRADELARHLPFVLAVVTGDPQPDGALRSACRLNPVLFTLNAEAKSVPLRKLRTGRLANRLADTGVETLGQLIQSATRSTPTAQVSELLGETAECIGRDGSFSWETYAGIRGLAALPASSPLTGTDFLASLNETIAALLLALYDSDRRSRIFELRTCRSTSQRLTLDQVARRLSTHGSSVKREETLMLHDLHAILIDGDFSEVPVWLDGMWLSFVREAHRIFEGSRTEYEVFLSRLSLNFEVSPRAAAAAAPALWAIFSGYPEGRKRRRAALTAAAQMQPVEPMRIMLRGFRRLH